MMIKSIYLKNERSIQRGHITLCQEDKVTMMLNQKTHLLPLLGIQQRVSFRKHVKKKHGYGNKSVMDTVLMEIDAS